MRSVINNGRIKVVYTSQKVDLSAHIDYVNQWFKHRLIDIDKSKKDCVVDKTTGEEYIFRYAVLMNYSGDCQNQEYMTVESSNSDYIWVLYPHWMTMTKDFINQLSIFTYNDLIDRHAMFKIAKPKPKSVW